MKETIFGILAVIVIVALFFWACYSAHESGYAHGRYHEEKRQRQNLRELVKLWRKQGWDVPNAD